MNGKLLLIVRSAPDRRMHVGEAMDAALICAAFGMQASILFEGDGLGYLEDPHFGELMQLADADDFSHMLALNHSGASPRQGVRPLALQQVHRELAAYQHFLVA